MLGFKEFLWQYNDEDVISLYLNSPDIKIREIASNTQKSIGEIYRILHSHHVKPNRLKINHQNVFDYALSGMSTQQIAELTGYSARNVRHILFKLI